MCVFVRVYANLMPVLAFAVLGIISLNLSGGSVQYGCNSNVSYFRHHCIRCFFNDEL